MSKGVLSKPLRVHLENTVRLAREVAEGAAQAALYQLGVGESRVPDYLSEEKKAVRRRLKAHGKALGDTMQHLVWEVAYEHWHRMLFARFLAENYLLMWELGAPVTLGECEQLVQDPITSLGAKSGWELAGKLAARMLPQVFKPESPVFELSLAPEHQRELERLLAGLPEEVFRTSDSLGWVYQFWQAKRKDEVNASEVKIGADELPAVTQLFTEPYMVEFQLHNSLGAWWVTRFPDTPCPVELTYLRKLDDGTPAAGKFEGWPNQLSEFKLLDPSCGSGHFLVAAFLMLVPMRMASEGLSARAAVDAVLAENLYGLELDLRCVEIAVFALALAAWRYEDETGGSVGIRAEMPSPHVACCGLKVTARPQAWEGLVPSALPNVAWLRQEMRRLHEGFSQAPLLGSLLDPSGFLKQDLATPDFGALSQFLQDGLASEQPSPEGAVQDATDDTTWDTALSAQGLLETARILLERYDLVITNVPYLARGKQSEPLKQFCDMYYPEAKNDLANVFLKRCLELAKENGAGVVQVVMPQNWLFLASYKKQRQQLLKAVTWNLLARLGAGAFETISGEVVNVVLLTQTRTPAAKAFRLRGLDVSDSRTAQAKAEGLKVGELVSVIQNDQLNNPSLRISLEDLDSGETLRGVADYYNGIQTGDWPRFGRVFWEIPERGDIWSFHQSTVDDTGLYGGMQHLMRWQGGGGDYWKFLVERLGEEGVVAWRRGLGAHGRTGVAVRGMGSLPASLYMGTLFDNNVTVLVPKAEADLSALWAFASSEEYSAAVRQLNAKMSVTDSAFVDVHFEAERWRSIAEETFPAGVPRPYSNDPTQWIFHGHPLPSTAPLQVAVARLIGYRWPAESDDHMELSGEAHAWIENCTALNRHADDDGILCLSHLRGEEPAHERLLALLVDAWETVEPDSWNNSVLDRLLADANCAGGLDVWLRDKFFEQHAKLFHHRPFIWHITDGLRDGFGALVNYHKLDAKNLERLIHTYLGDWIRSQEAGVARGVDGAPQRLAAALLLKLKLVAILEGEHRQGAQGYDIFVRWKRLDQQPIGWNPDLNDGVRLNIRPFMKAQVLRHNAPPKLNIKWEKDRGRDVDTAPWCSVFDGERINDHHLTLAEKRAAREAAREHYAIDNPGVALQ